MPNREVAAAKPVIVEESSYDGYAAAVVSDAAVEALHTGDRIAVKLIDKPALYA